jgi:hypothetical protein
MTWLKKYGSLFLKVVGVISGVTPLIQQAVPTTVGTETGKVVDKLNQIGNMVVLAEALIQGAGKGSERLTAATPLVGQVIQTSELLVGKKITNEALFEQGCTKITSGMADVLNSLGA